MRFFGRRTLFLFGLTVQFGLLFIVGCMGIPTQTVGLSWAVGGLLLAYTFIYDLTVGSLSFSESDKGGANPCQFTGPGSLELFPVSA